MSDAWSPALVTTGWVADHLGDLGAKLVEVDVDPTLYAEGHIEGAVGWNWTTDLQDRVRRDVLSREDFASLMGRSGITREDTVILYGDANNWFAAYAYWQMKLHGHDRVKLMDGGRLKWEKEGRPYTTALPQPTPQTYVAGPERTELRALQPEVFGRIGEARSAMVDVRSPAEFTGEVLAPPGLTETAQRGGHIPGAVNIPWSQAVGENGAFKSRDELAALYASKGITPDKDVIAYCRIGERSSHTWFVLKELLGYPQVKNYDGSWTEWGSMVGVPVEKL